ncbi:DUF397 domain-containing protein [Streptomyces corynorhini]|uniref:DUF397 domain-containing protein n=1 Tax=Streptomyces corynorhini TaxID=2282652 RepID=A0A370BFF3_9ACTN|nr:DUF397 domain-containing protein [Streptomyces corynorhini]RDG38426.1 DUF397 domain-containing protein [Streptomyces corynorhini]
MNACPVWRRSSYSTGANNCVESARSGPDALVVRDSKEARRPPLSFSGSAWSCFLSALREREPVRCPVG